MRHRKLPVVGKWRVPFSEYMNFIPSTKSVSCLQLLRSEGVYSALSDFHLLWNDKTLDNKAKLKWKPQALHNLRRNTTFSKIIHIYTFSDRPTTVEMTRWLIKYIWRDVQEPKEDKVEISMGLVHLILNKNLTIPK